jgi:hypothetical protein
MENIVINNYNYDSFFDHYFNNDEEWMNKYESPLLDYVLEQLPEYINTVINFGCANGRDFIPFQDKFTCVGFDLASPNTIKWACKTDNLTYYQCSIEDYIYNFNHDNIDLSSTLIYTQGSLMYVSHENQTKLIEHFLNKKCKNIVIHEYPPEYPHSQGYFNPSYEILNIFERKHFRTASHNQPTGFLYLNK